MRMPWMRQAEQGSCRKSLRKPFLELLEDRRVPAGSVFGNQIQNLYRFGLNREPDPGGYAHFVQQMEQGRPLGSVADAILDSDEHNTAVITSYYRILLGREPDSAGLVSFVAAANRGAPEQQLVGGFLGSDEHSGSMGNAEYLNWLYLNVLGHQPDSEGFAANLRALEAGVSRVDMAWSFMRSRDLSLFVVEDLYHGLLGRGNSSEESQGWLQALSGTDFEYDDAVRCFFASPEGSARAGASVFQGTFPGEVAWWQKGIGLDRLARPDDYSAYYAAQANALANQMRAVQTDTNPVNPGRIVAQLRANDFPNLSAANDPGLDESGTSGASFYPTDGLNAPGPFRMDLARVGQVDPLNPFAEQFGQWDGVAGSPKGTTPNDTRIAFTRDTLAQFFGIQVDAAGLITRIGCEAAAVLLHQESIAIGEGFDPLANPLIGQHIDLFQEEQLSLHMAMRSPADPTEGLDDPRVAPDAVLARSLGLQQQVCKSALWASYQNFRESSFHAGIFRKAMGLYGATLRITASDGGFGIQQGAEFWSKWNTAFVMSAAFLGGDSAAIGIFSAVVQADETGVGTWQSDPSTLITFRKVADGSQSVDKVFTVDRTPSPVRPGLPSVLHCAAVGSPLDVYHSNHSSWGVANRTGNLDYTRQGPALEVDGTTVLPPVAGSLLVNYSGMANAQILTAGGPGSCHIVAKAGGGATQGTGVIDARGLAGSLFVQADSSLGTVYLGSGPCVVVGSALGESTRFILHPQMAESRTAFRALRLETDRLNLGGFVGVSGLGAMVTATFDNHAADLAVYQRHTSTVEVFFDSDGTGGRVHHRFQVLVAEDAATTPEDLAARVLGAVEINPAP